MSSANVSANEHDSLLRDDNIIDLEAYRVVSTATRTERLALDVPVKTEVLGPELFFSANTGDIAAALEYLPGARVEANCQNCGTSEVKLLGLGSGYNRLLFDGQPLFSGLAAVYGLEHIPTSFIERIEVVKGGSSSLYGAGAVAGVINIIPHEPIENGTDFTTTFESIDGNPSVTLTGKQDWYEKNGTHAGTVFGDYRQNDSVDLNGDGITEITEKDFYTTGTQAWFYPIENGRVRFNYAYTWEKRRGGDHLDWLPHESQITEQLEHRWHRGGLFWEQDLNEQFSYKIGGSLSNIERDSYYGGIGDVILPGENGFDSASHANAIEDAKLLYGFTRSERTYLDSLFTYRKENHTWSWGAQYQKDDVFDEKRNNLNNPLRSDGSIADFSAQDPIADDSFNNVGVFIQNEWDPDADWTVILGIRGDKHSKLDDWVLSPRGAVRYTFSEEFIFRASISTGFRAPEIFDEDFHIEILEDPTRVKNDPDLKEEKSSSYAAGFIWTPKFAENKLQMDVELYRTEIKDTFHVADIISHDANGNAFKTRVNADGSVIQGFELNGLYRFSKNFSIDAGVTYNDPRFDEQQEILPGVFEERYIETPRWSGTLQLNYSNDELFDAFLGVVYTGPMIAINEVQEFVNESTDHFFVMDFSLTKHFSIGESVESPHLDVSIGVRNLLDQRQDDLETGPNRDGTYFYGPRFPRSFFVSVRTHF